MHSHNGYYWHFPFYTWGNRGLGGSVTQSQACSIQAVGVPRRSASGYWRVVDRRVGVIDFIPSLLPAGERNYRDRVSSRPACPKWAGVPGQHPNNSLGSPA